MLISSNIICSKIRYYESSFNAEVRHVNPAKAMRIQLVGLSATMGNVQQLSEWLCAELFVSDFRPVPLLEHIVAGNQLIAMDKTGQVCAERILSKNDVSVTVTKNGIRKTPFADSDHVVSLTAQALQKGINTPRSFEINFGRIIIIGIIIENHSILGQQVLIFCPTKASCSQTCRLLCDNIQDFLPSATTRFKRKSDNSTSWDSVGTPIISHSFALSPQQQVEARKQAVQSLLALEKSTASAPASSDLKKDRESQIIAGLDESTMSPLAAAVLAGVAFHHAGLNTEERDIVENCYRKGIISVLAGTYSDICIVHSHLRATMLSILAHRSVMNMS